MKKYLLVSVFYFICFKSFPIIFWQPYPIVATLNGNAGHQRIECSVYDSLLGSTQYFNTPYYPDSVLVESDSSGIICFRTYSLVSADYDSSYGYLIYDQELHQFKPVYRYHQDPDYPGVDIGIYDNMVLVYYQCCRNDLEVTGYSSFYYSYLYDITAHQWIDGPSNGAMADGWCSLQIGKGAFVLSSYNDWDWDPYHWCWFYDPVNRNFPGLTALTFTFGQHGNQDCYYLFDDVQFAGSDAGLFSAFDPGNHTWSQFSVDPVDDSKTFAVNGIIYVAEDDIPSEIDIYDDSTHLWIMDYLEHEIHYVTIKDRVVAYVDSAYTQIYYEAFSPSQRVWVKDSSLINILDTIYISEGTVTWVDGSGTHIAGYDDAVGWGNFNTPLQLNFHLTDFYSSTGYPLFYVRDYSIGTDSTWYDFGDGIITSPGEQHSLWHMAKLNGHYAPLAANYNVCIYANTSAGVQSWCGSRTQACSVDFNFNSSCTGLCNGNASAVPLTGAAPFSYLWSNGDTTALADSLCNGDFSVTITDNAGCSVSHSFTLDTLKASVTATAVSCIGSCDGTSSVIVDGGTTPYSYSWSSGDTTQAVENLCGINYTVSVTDINGCTASENINIPQPAPLQANGAIDSQSNCIIPNGVMYLYPTGGTGSYTISWIPNIGSVDSIQGEFFVSVPPGNYLFTISDVVGCTDTVSATFINPPLITAFSVAATDPLCAGDCNGSIIPSVTGGTAPFQYYKCTFGIQPLNNLCAGVYCIEVEDENFCTLTDTFTITDPLPLLVISNLQDPSCAACTDGMIILNLAGATPPYLINWSPQFGSLSGDTIQNLPAGTYLISVEDIRGCDTSFNITLVSTVGILEAKELENIISIFPNPVNSKLTVGYENPVSNRDREAINTIEIYNLLGEKFISIKNSDQIKKEQLTIDVSAIPSGIYFIKVQTEKGTTVQKFIKQ